MLSNGYGSQPQVPPARSHQICHYWLEAVTRLVAARPLRRQALYHRGVGPWAALLSALQELPASYTLLVAAALLLPAVHPAAAAVPEYCFELLCLAQQVQHPQPRVPPELVACGMQMP